MQARSSAHTASIDNGEALCGSGALVEAIRSRMASAFRNNKDVVISPPRAHTGLPHVATLRAPCLA
eukprot:2576294-Amphidinium_carterae.1